MVGAIHGIKVVYTLEEKIFWLEPCALSDGYGRAKINLVGGETTPRLKWHRNTPRKIVESGVTILSRYLDIPKRVFM